MQKVYIWDFPTRLFHWLLVVAITGQYITAELLDDAITWHSYGGYFILGLIIFRVLWGIWGARYAQFSAFIRSPKTVWLYAKQLRNNEFQASDGHNPLGAYAIIFILLILAIQAVSGLFITDDIFFNGPYYSVASESIRDIMNWLHNNGFYAIWLFLILHLSAILFYKLRLKQHLTKAMLSGHKQAVNRVTRKDAENHWLRFCVLALVSVIITYLLVVTFAPEIVDEFYY